MQNKFDSLRSYLSDIALRSQCYAETYAKPGMKPITRNNGCKGRFKGKPTGIRRVEAVSG